MIRSFRANAPRVSGRRCNSARRAALLTAVLGVVAGGSIASAQSRTWDNTGGLQPPDWANGTIPSSAGIWDPTNAAGNPGGAPTHWNGNTDVGAGNTGVLSITPDPMNPTYSAFIEMPNAAEGAAGGLSVTQGSFIVPGFGNGGLGHGSVPSYIDTGSGPFNIDVVGGASLTLGYRLNLLSFKGSATIVKTGDGSLNAVMNLLRAQLGAGTFTGKWDIQQGHIGLFFGGDTMLGDPASFVANQLTVSNNAEIDTYQGSTAIQVGGNEGITIGSGGVTFFNQGEHQLDGSAITQIGSVVFNSTITGGSSGSPVPITWKSNVNDAVSNGGGLAQGSFGSLYHDNHTTLFARWIVNTGEIVPNSAKADNGLTSNNDLGLGAVPSSYLFNAITLDRDTTGTAATDINGNAWQSNVLVGGPNIRIDKFGGMTIPANRGIYLGPGGGGLHPADTSNAAHNILTIASIISGPGQLRVLLDQSQAIVILNGADNYSGGTWITAAQGSAPQSNAYLQVSTATLPPHQAGFTNTGTITVGQYTLPNSDVIDDGTLTFDQTFDGSYGGTISTSSVSNYTPLGNVTKNSAGAVFLTGNNTYVGNTTINGGALVADSTAALPGYNVGGRVVVNSGAALAVTSTNWASADINTVRSSATFNSGSYFGFNVPSASSYAYDTSSHPANAGVFKIGGGDLTITGNNSGSGATWIRGGTVLFATGAALGNPAGTITINGGTLQYGSSTNMGNHPIVLDAVNGGTISQPNGYQDSSHGAAVTGGPLTYSGSTGSLFSATRYSLSQLNIAGGTLAVAANGTATGVSRVANLTIAANAKLDLGDNKLITSRAVGSWNGTNYTDMTGYVASGRGTGNFWDGASGIITSQFAAHGSNYTTIGVAKASDAIPPTATATALWAGQTVTGTDTLVMYTYGGDATLDGRINVDDYIRIDSGIAAHLTGWSNGDFNYDGVVNIDDYTQFIDANIGIQGPQFFTSGGLSGGAAGVSAVPEPASLALLSAAAGGLLARRRRASSP